MAMCADCKQPLIIFIDPDSDIEENTAGEALDANQGRPVDDDVELECGCHFHWCVNNTQGITCTGKLTRPLPQAMPFRCIFTHRVSQLWEKSTT